MDTLREFFDSYLSKQKIYISHLSEKNKIDPNNDRTEYISILENNLKNDKNAIDEIISMQYKFFHHFYWRTFIIVWVSKKDDHIMVKQGKQKARYTMHISEVINNIFTK